MIKTRGIVISHIKYKETSIIAKIFTEALGLKSYIINGVRTKKPKYNPAMFHPLNILDMVVYNKKKSGLQYISEIRNHSYFYNLENQIEKGLALTIFSELLDKTLREDVNYENIFEFIFESISELNDSSNKEINFYILKFFVFLTRYLGFGINDVKELDNQIRSVNEKHKLNNDEKTSINNIINNNDFDKNEEILIISLLKKIIIYYKIHFPTLINLKSLRVFEDLKI